MTGLSRDDQLIAKARKIGAKDVANPGGGPQLLARSKCVMPRSKACRHNARLVSSGVSSPKLCQSPSEIAGSFSPDRPQR